MADHIATAQRYRARAAKCELSAKATSSAKFGECYRLLAQHFLVLANLEEDCAHRSSPFARQDNKQDNKQDSKPANQENNKSPGPIGRSADVCSAAIANGGSVHGDRVDAADGGRGDTERRIRPLSA